MLKFLKRDQRIIIFPTSKKTFLRLAIHEIKIPQYQIQTHKKYEVEIKECNFSNSLLLIFLIGPHFLKAAKKREERNEKIVQRKSFHALN